ncbi:hypothetical protein MUK70_00970 [Dyadobacter chenwenxiniae]|uniref:O-antigen ligase n=1 Tax=Dyadobacter chenwenxiniae TaxID=2906456 RepID=A0A9X1TFG9_9BACT|nr:hypothetical protein [Dyadobacter chenwenxiniae]MCF0062680.1 hypothetical protein [Dyadobacter chenwenxiniae]UON83575.1 hypothetical protein MUK70_00970 [Dyadobacter chenwenxiniae]
MQSLTYPSTREILTDKKTVFLFFLVICSLKYFGAVAAQNGILKNICYAYMVAAILISAPKFFSYKGGFVLPIQLICISIVISIFMAKYTWGQGLEHSVSTIPYMMWFIFFYLLSSNISIRTIENIVLIYGLLYMLLFIFQLTHTGTIYFGTVEEFKEDRGIIRVNFPGGGVFFLACFIAINKVTSDVKYRLIWTGYAAIGLIVNVLQVTRQTIAVMLFIYMLHFLRNVKLPLKIATIATFGLGCYLFLVSDNPISRGLAEQQKADASAGDEYIRIVSAKYFLTEFTPNTVSQIFGNGFFNETSNYGKRLNALSLEYGYFLSDVGLVEVYVTFGVLAIIGFAMLFIKSFTIPVDADHYYLKYYLWMIMVTSLSSDFLVSYYYVITTALVLYCYHRLYEEQKIISMFQLKRN